MIAYKPALPALAALAALGTVIANGCVTVCEDGDVSGVNCKNIGGTTSGSVPTGPSEPDAACRPCPGWPLSAACQSSPPGCCPANSAPLGCCTFDGALEVCAKAAGILTHYCGGECASGFCAVSPNGARTCCLTPDAGGFDPCDVSVP